MVAAIAATQHGIVTFSQLIEAGLGRSAVARRVAAGRLHRIHRGVYAVGHAALSNEGRWIAAVLACGDMAVLSHRSAAELSGLLPPRSGDVHVTVATAAGRAQRDGVRVHRPHSLLVENSTVRDRIPVTTSVRTLADLQGAIEPYLQ